jgi:glutamate-1-semialdehyde 2,1-aminomutase
MATARTSINNQYVRLHPRSAQLYEESLRTFPSGVTHDIRFLTPFPIFVDHASGSRKWDVDGREYVDYVMGHGALFMGHAHPQITAAVVEQAKKGTHYGANHELELEWGRSIQDLVPSAEAVRFTSSGTEATLMALRLARAYTGRDKVLKFDDHFHGWHDAVVGARQPEQESPQSSGVPGSVSANTISVPQGDVAAVESRLSENDIAAVIIEPTGKHWGDLPLRPEFLSVLRELTARNNVILIFDEVVTGFRISPGGAQARYGVTPDLTTLAKIAAGGLPGGAVAGKSDVIGMIEFRTTPNWNAEQRVMHPGTFNANPLSSAAGSSMLSLVKGGAHHDHADGLVSRLVPALNDTLRELKAPGCAYGLGSTFHVSLGTETERPDGVEWTFEAPPPMTPANVVMALKRGMLNQGVDLMGGSGGFTSGVHTDADIDLTVQAFKETIAQMQADGIL